MANRPLLIGLSGAIGAGKSTVMRAFAQRGCACLSADAIVHTLYHQARVRDLMVERFGQGVLDEAGEVDRVSVATRVFTNPADLAWLEQTLHPLVQAEMSSWVEEVRRRFPLPPLIVYESPLLFEAGLEEHFDRTLAVVVPDDVRRARVDARGGLERLDEREQRMWTADRRAAAADDVIVNAGDESELLPQIDAYIARYAGP